MSTEVLTILFTGIAGLIAAASTFNNARSKRQELEYRYLKGRAEILERQVLDLRSDNFELKSQIASMGGKPPPGSRSLDKPLPEEVFE